MKDMIRFVLLVCSRIKWIHFPRPVPDQERRGEKVSTEIENVEQLNLISSFYTVDVFKNLSKEGKVRFSQLHSYEEILISLQRVENLK